jgi:hypothetical protein
MRGASPRRRFALLPESEEFCKIVQPGTQLTLVGRGFGFTEEPVWDPTGFLYVSDEEQNKNLSTITVGKLPWIYLERYGWPIPSAAF